MQAELVACETAIGAFSLGDTCPAACVRALSGAADATKSCVGRSTAAVAPYVDQLTSMVSGYCDGACLSSFVPEVAQLMTQCASASAGKSAPALAYEWVTAHCTQVTTSSGWTPQCDVVTAMMTGKPLPATCQVGGQQVQLRQPDSSGDSDPAAQLQRLRAAVPGPVFERVDVVLQRGVAAASEHAAVGGADGECCAAER